MRVQLCLTIEMPFMRSCTWSVSAPVYAEAAKLHAQLGQDAIDVPMMETGPDEAPSEEAEREQLRTQLANLDASIAALTPVAAGDEDVCQILQAEHEKRKRIQAQLSALRPLKTRLRASHETHKKANKKNKALVEEESVMALLVAKQSLTQQAKEARDVKAKELEEARTAREGSAQSTRNSSTRSSSPMSPAQWAAGLQSALDGEVKESFNQWLKQFGVQARVEIPTILGPERGLEMLTAVQWRQKLGLTDFRCDHVFERGCCQSKRMDCTGMEFIGVGC